MTHKEVDIRLNKQSDSLFSYKSSSKTNLLNIRQLWSGWNDFFMCSLKKKIFIYLYLTDLYECFVSEKPTILKIMLRPWSRPCKLYIKILQISSCRCMPFGYGRWARNECYLNFVVMCGNGLSRKWFSVDNALLMREGGRERERRFCILYIKSFDS